MKRSSDKPLTKRFFIYLVILYTGLLILAYLVTLQIGMNRFHSEIISEVSGALQTFTDTTVEPKIELVSSLGLLNKRYIQQIIQESEESLDKIYNQRYNAYFQDGRHEFNINDNFSNYFYINKLYINLFQEDPIKPEFQNCIIAVRYTLCYNYLEIVDKSIIFSKKLGSHYGSVIYRNTQLFIIITLVYFSLIFATRFLLNALLSRPFQQFSYKISKINPTKLESLEAVKGGGEFEQLAQAINQLLENIKERGVSEERLKNEVRNRMEAEVRLRKTLAELQETQKKMLHVEKLSALGTFVGGVAHELNNPIMGVSNYLSFVSRRTTDEEAKDILEKAQEELDRMARIVRNLLMYGRLKSETSGHCDISKVLDATLSILEPKLKTSNIHLTSDLDPNGCLVRISSDGMQQILMNLLTNAIDAGEGRPDNEVTVTSKRVEDKVTVRVADGAGGVPENIAEKIFDPFFTTKPPGKGTGLGLSVAAQLAMDANGDIGLENRPGIGASMWVTIPVYTLDAEQQNE